MVFGDRLEGRVFNRGKQSANLGQGVGWVWGPSDVPSSLAPDDLKDAAQLTASSVLAFSRL